MTSFVHGSSCQCSQYRGQRTTERIAPLSRHEVVPLAPIAPTEEELAAIAQDQLAFVLATREADMSVQVIRNKLIQASSDATEDEVDSLLGWLMASTGQTGACRASGVSGRA